MFGTVDPYVYGALPYSPLEVTLDSTGGGFDMKLGFQTNCCFHISK